MSFMAQVIVIFFNLCIYFPVAQMIKRLPAMWKAQVRSLGWEDPLQNEMAIHSSICLENSMDRGT